MTDLEALPGDRRAENLGPCAICGKDVAYEYGMTTDDPHYPMHEFSQEDQEDVLGHWGCLDPGLFAAKAETP